MKTLTILRHAKSSWKNARLHDRDRPLSSRGKRDAPIMGQRIVDAGIRPSLIVSSPAVRAWATAKIVAREMNYPREFLQRDDRLYHAGVSAIAEVIGEQDPAFNSIMIVGHNPGLTDFANFLVPDLTSNIPTCGVVSVTIDADDWNLHAGHEVALALFDYPKRAGK